MNIRILNKDETKSLSSINYDIPPNLFMMIIMSKYTSKSYTYFLVIFDLKIMDVSTALNVVNPLSKTKKRGSFR